MAILENINIDKDSLENIDIDKEILQNIDIIKIKHPYLQENPWDGTTRKEICLNLIDSLFPNAYDDLTIAENIDEKTTKGI